MNLCRSTDVLTFCRRPAQQDHKTIEMQSTVAAGNVPFVVRSICLRNKKRTSDA